MSKKFYQMKLTDFKCGWADSLKQAEEEFPEGTIIVVQAFFPDDNIDGNMDVFYDPVGTYNKMVKSWDELCIKVKTIVSRGIKIEDLPELLKLDILLYDIYLEFIEDQEYDVCVNYEPKKFSDITPDFYELYFNNADKYKMF